jgi:hypothetical protein
VAQPHGPSLISRVIQADYTYVKIPLHFVININVKASQQWCEWAFTAGEYNEIPEQPEMYWYEKYGGFNLRADRLALIDGSEC